MHGDPTNVKLPAVALDENATVPDGVIAVPGEVSCTVAVQVVDEPTVTGDGEQATVVVVARTVTVTTVLPELLEWFVSPLKLAVRV